jgi:hypothetical protein
MGRILHGGTHTHPFIAPVGLKAHSADRRGRRSRYALTTLTRKNPGSTRSHFKAQGPQQPRARKRAIGPHSPRSIGGSRLNATDEPQRLQEVSNRHHGGRLKRAPALFRADPLFHSPLGFVQARTPVSEDLCL